MFGANRQMMASSPMSTYAPTTARLVKKGLHLGQRKLILSEVEFITAIANGEKRRILVVYAGAACGSHLPYLMRLFPKVSFILIDPAPFCSEIEEMDCGTGRALVELVHECCTDALCTRLRDSYASDFSIYFISDIRSGNPPDLSNYENTLLIERDNKAQLQWSRIIGAERAMLKFHPPYPSSGPDDATPPSIQYAKGNVMWGVWAPKSSTETRLIVSSPFIEEVTYDCKEFEQMCYYYNSTNRYASDINAEKEILGRYISTLEEKDKFTVTSLSAAISEILGMPDFLPLSDDFSENDARLYILLYQARCQNISEVFSQWRGKVTFEDVVSWGNGGSEPKVPFWRKYAFRKPVLEAFCVMPPKRQRGDDGVPEDK